MPECSSVWCDWYASRIIAYPRKSFLNSSGYIPMSESIRGGCGSLYHILPLVHRNNYSGPVGGTNKDRMATSLPVEDEAGRLSNPDKLPCFHAGQKGIQTATWIGFACRIITIRPCLYDARNQSSVPKEHNIYNNPSRNIFQPSAISVTAHRHGRPPVPITAGPLSCLTLLVFRTMCQLPSGLPMTGDNPIHQCAGEP